jgi:hypothetical protein
MFLDRAFAEADNDYISARTLEPGNEEFDFLSHLRVSQDIQIRERPNEHDFQVVHGNLDLWLEQLKKSVEGGVEDGAQEIRLTPTKEESCESGATHYIVCETKVSRAKKSVLQRLQQLERKVGYLVRRAYGDDQVDVGSCVALAGIGAPRSGAVNIQKVNKVLNSNQTNLPLLSALNNIHRLFLLVVETTADRLQILEQGQEQQRQAQEEQRRVLEEQLLCMREEQLRAQEEQRRLLEERLQHMQEELH